VTAIEEKFGGGGDRVDGGGLWGSSDIEFALKMEYKREFTDY